ncbi:unnamed protein product, partial [Ectocarpus sp. 12 AP-2014]
SVAADETGWRYALNGRIDEIEASRLLEIWPEAALVKPRIWVDENVMGGRLLDLDLAVRGSPGVADPDVYADFEFENGTVRFSPNMPLLRDAAGQASFVDNRLVATATSGRVESAEGGDVNVVGTSFIAPDVRVKPGTPAIVRIVAHATPTAVLSLLDRPPLSLMSKANLPVALAQGEIDVTGTLALPMQETVLVTDMDFHASGTIRDASSTVLVPDHELVSDELSLFVDNDHVEISGAGEM